MYGRSSDFLLNFKDLPEKANLFSGKEHSRNIIGGSQQRDCPGFAPDSLLIHPQQI